MSSNTEGTLSEYSHVDTRVLKSGKTRLRFKLSDEAYFVVSKAISAVCYQWPSTSLDALAMNYMAGAPAVPSPGIPAQGTNRMLIRLFPDQYECVRSALDLAGHGLESDEAALLKIATVFLYQEKPKDPVVQALVNGESQLANQESTGQMS